MKPIEALVETISSHVKGGDAVYTLSAPINVPILKPDHTYKNSPMVGNEEFFLKGVRAGAGDKLIFEFTPVASAAYSQAEFSEKVVFTAFGDSIYGTLLAALGATAPTPWVQARTAFLKKAAVAKVKEIKEDALGTYETNPLWGSF